MDENINLVEILKDCPMGTKLWHSIYGEVEFNFILDCDSICFNTSCGLKYIEKDGRALKGVGDCLIFPSKNQRDWSKFTTPRCKKERFDPKTLQPFDKVLVRNICSEVWKYNVYRNVFYVMVIPYNEDTKHLVGTKEEAPEYYRFWED